ERAVRVVSRERDGVVTRVDGADHDDLAVGLEREVLRFGVIRPELRGDLAARTRTEARIEAAARVVANEAEVPVTGIEGETPDHDAPVGLDREPGALVVAPREVRGEPAVTVERPVETAVGVVPSDSEVPVAAVVAVAGDDDLAVGLQRDRVAPVAAPTDVRRDDTV